MRVCMVCLQGGLKEDEVVPDVNSYIHTRAHTHTPGLEEGVGQEDSDQAREREQGKPRIRSAQQHRGCCGVAQPDPRQGHDRPAGAVHHIVF